MWLWVVCREEAQQPPRAAVTDDRKNLGWWSHWHGSARMASGWSDLNQDGEYSKRESVDGTCVHCRSGDTQEAEHVVLRGGS